MAEVPDIVQCTTSNKKLTDAASEETPSLPSENVENLTMDAEDSLPAVPTPSTAAEGASTFVTLDSSSNSEYNFDDSTPLPKRIETLEEQELIMVRRNASNFYSMLFALYFADLDWQKGRLCRLRVEAMLSRSDTQLRALVAMAKHLEEQQFGLALKASKEANCTDMSLRNIMSVVQERLRLYVLLMVQKSYISIEVNRLAQMLDIPPLKIPEVVNGYGWVVSANGFVYPRLSQEFTGALDEQKKTPFGAISLKASRGPEKKCLASKSGDALRNLAKFVSSMET